MLTSYFSISYNKFEDIFHQMCYLAASLIVQPESYFLLLQLQYYMRENNFPFSPT